MKDLSYSKVATPWFGKWWAFLFWQRHYPDQVQRL